MKTYLSLIFLLFFSFNSVFGLDINWSKIDLKQSNYYYSIWGLSEDDIYISGNNGNISHYNGVDISRIDTKTNEHLWSIWGSSGNNIFAVGTRGTIIHYDGTTWNNIKTDYNNNLYDIWASSSDNVYVVGEGIVLHYNGIKWNKLEIGLSDIIFFSIWGNSPDDIYIAGDSGFILHFDGFKWVQHETNVYSQLWGIWSNSKDTFAVGSPWKYQSTFLHYNGHEWKNIKNDYNVHLWDVWGIDETNIFAVGDSGKIFHYNGKEIQLVETKSSSRLLSIWKNNNTVYALSENNGIYYNSFDNNNIEKNTPPTIIGNFEITQNEDEYSKQILFEINDAQSPASELDVYVTSSNQALIPDNNLIIKGDGKNKILEISPVKDEYGASTIILFVSDSIETTIKTFKYKVNPVNDPPKFEGGSPLEIYEDSGSQIINNWASNIITGPENELDQNYSFFVETDNPDLFLETPFIKNDGTLIFKPKPDMFGLANLSVFLKDSGGVINNGIDISPKFFFYINIISVNDSPEFTKGININVYEDSGFQSYLNWATNISPGNYENFNQNISFVLDTDNKDLFSQLPSISANGTLTFVPAADKNGIANITVQLIDNGGIDFGGKDRSKTQSFTINIIPVNDLPEFQIGKDIEIWDDSGSQIIKDWVKDIKAGPIDEIDQNLKFVLYCNNPELFSYEPEITPDGTLMFCPIKGKTGQSLVSVRLFDNGDEIKNENIQTFSIYVKKSINISGKIKYYSNGYPINNVLLTLEGEKSYTTVSDVNGFYEFIHIEQGNYRLYPSKKDDLGALSATDASEIFRYAENNNSLSCFEMIAGDVSQNGTISSIDGSRVASYRAGLLDCLNDECVNWVFIEDTAASEFSIKKKAFNYKKQCTDWPEIPYSFERNYNNIQSSLSEEDFIGIRLGDITGNWPKIEDVEEKYSNNQQNSTVENNLILKTFNPIIVPVILNDYYDIKGIDIDVNYDKNILISKGANLNEDILESQNYELIVNNKFDIGKITILVSAKNEILPKKGTILNLIFEPVKNDLNKLDNAKIIFETFECNELKQDIQNINLRQTEIVNCLINGQVKTDVFGDEINIKGATIVLQSADKQYYESTITDESGKFSFCNIIDGIYEISAISEYFQTKKMIISQSNENNIYNFNMDQPPLPCNDDDLLKIYKTNKLNSFDIGNDGKKGIPEAIDALKAASDINIGE